MRRNLFSDLYEHGLAMPYRETGAHESDDFADDERLSPFLGFDEIGLPQGLSHISFPKTSELARAEEGNTDIPGDTSSTILLDFVNDNTGQISATDADWFRVEALDSEIVHLRIFDADFRRPNFTVSIFDENGNLVDSETGENSTNFGYTHEFDNAGTYFIALSTDATELNYRVEAWRSIDDYAGDTQTIGTIDIDDGVVVGTFNRTTEIDQDWFKFEVRKGELIEFNLDAEARYSDIRFTDADGNLVYIPSYVPIDHFLAPDSGTYFIHISGSGLDGTRLQENYTLTATNHSDIIPGHVSTEAVIVIDGEEYTGNSEYRGDVDWIAFDVTAPGILSFNFNSPSVSEPPFRIYDENGIILDGLDGYIPFYNSDFLSSYLFNSAGRYYIEIQDNSIGEYTLTAQTVNDDYTGVIEDMVELDGRLIIGSLDAIIDQDTFSFSAEENVDVRFTLRGIYDNATDFSHYRHALTVQVRNAQGDIVSTSTSLTIAGQPVQSLLQFTPETSGTFTATIFLDRRGFSLSTERIGYNFFAETIDDDQSDGETIELLLNETPHQGLINYVGDEDYFSVTVDTPGNYVIDASGNTSNLLTLRIANEQGNELAAGISQLLFTAGTAGTYQISIQGLTLEDSGNYSIAFQSAADDHGDTLEAATVIDVSTPPTTHRIDSSDDTDLFRLDASLGDVLEISTIGLAGENIIFEVLDSDGTVLRSNTDSLGVFTETFRLTIEDATATYLRISNSQNETAVYSLDITTVDSENETIRSQTDGVDRLHGFAGDDLFILSTRDGNDILNGGDGFDTLRYVVEDGVSHGLLRGITPDGDEGFQILTLRNWNGPASPSRIDQTTISIERVEIASDETTENLLSLGLLGTNGDDTLSNRGETVENYVRILAGDGNDFIETVGNLRSYLYAGDGDDTIIAGGSYANFVDGGAGADTITFERADFWNILSYFTSSAGVSIDLGAGAFSGGDATGDTITGIVDFLSASNHNDNLTGTNGSEEFRGNDGDDIINGGAGADKLYGNNDNDTLNGGLGDDQLYGGSGADTFIFEQGGGLDVIHDFEVGVDRLMLDLSPYTSTEAFMDMVSQRDGYVEINLGNGDAIRLQNMTLADLSLEDVLLGYAHEDGLGPFRDPGGVELRDGIDKDGAASQGAKATDVVYDDPETDAASGSVDPVALYEIEAGLI